jgi:hypothetical protein
MGGFSMYHWLFGLVAIGVLIWIVMLALKHRH